MKTRLKNDSFLLTTPIAHRGLWEEGKPENSLPAYQNAVDNNIPIEMDVQMSCDGVLFCFHDDNLKRMTGVDKDIRTLHAEEIRSLDIGGQKIPYFYELLDLVNGKVPLLIEIKQQLNKGVEQKIVDSLKNYKGEYAIQSFDPFIMLRIKKLAPHIIRGQLGANNDKKGLKWHVLKNLSFNFLTKPDFVHYSLSGLPLSKRITNNLPLMCWTVSDEEGLNTARKYAQNFVFEKIRP